MDEFLPCNQMDRLLQEMVQIKQRKEAGFTLLESIFVLSVVSLIALVAVGIFPKFEEKKGEKFLEQFRRDVVFMQQSAMSHSTRHKLHFLPANHQYVITNEMETILVRNYDHELLVELDTLSSPLIYGADGNINKGGTMYVSFKSKKYKVVFQLGEGRFSYYLT